MSALTILTQLEIVGITLWRSGDDLHFTISGDVSIGPYMPTITAHKRELLAELQRIERKQPVEASTPPPGWDGTIPGNCGVPHVCATLGPGPHCSLTGCAPGLARGDRTEEGAA